jgi:hypothetical protein
MAHLTSEQAFNQMLRAEDVLILKGPELSRHQRKRLAKLRPACNCRPFVDRTGKHYRGNATKMQLPCPRARA